MGFANEMGLGDYLPAYPADHRIARGLKYEPILPWRETSKDKLKKRYTNYTSYVVATLCRGSRIQTVASMYPLQPLRTSAAPSGAFNFIPSETFTMQE